MAFESGMLPGREQILDEFADLATVEHALCVDFLQVYCALGAGAVEVADPVPAAAQASMDLAVDQMRHLRRVNQTLLLAGRVAAMGRATHVQRPSGPPIAVGSLTPEQFERFPEREHAIATEVDRRYARLRAAVEGPRAPFEGELLDQVTFVLDSVADHRGGVDTLTAHLAGLVPADYLQATRTEPADEPERLLLAASDRCYQAVVAMLHAEFTPGDPFGGQPLQLAVGTMDRLDSLAKLLATRGLIPAFTPAGD